MCLLQISPLYATVFVASMLFPALSTIFKEQIFTKAKETLKGKQLDIFVVRPCCCQLMLSEKQKPGADKSAFRGLGWAHVQGMGLQK